MKIYAKLGIYLIFPREFTGNSLCKSGENIIQSKLRDGTVDQKFEDII